MVLLFMDALKEKLPAMLRVDDMACREVYDDLVGAKGVWDVSMLVLMEGVQTRFRYLTKCRGLRDLQDWEAPSLEDLGLAVSQLLSSGWSVDVLRYPTCFTDSPGLVRVPSVDSTFMHPKDWRLTFRGRWERASHINELELRTAVLLLRHLARTRKHHRRRVLLLLDSLVALGVLCKGRSSSYPLLRLARQAASVQLVLGVRLYCRHVESALNTADGPSRGQPVGAAPETIRAHKDFLGEVYRRAQGAVRVWEYLSGSF